MLMTKLWCSAGFIALGLASTLALAKTEIPKGRYNIDPVHSKVGFEVPHLVISSVEGKFKEFSGNIDTSEGFEKAKIEASVSLASVDTSVEKRDEHLKSPDFFDVAKFPKMLFKSTSLSGTPDAFDLKGDLTIKGVTKSVVFKGRFLGSVKDAYGQDKVAFVAETTLKRQDFGLVWSKMVEAGPVVGDQVKIDLKIQAVKAAKK